MGRGLEVNTFPRRRFASQTKPLQECHPERSEGSLAGQRSFAALRMTKRDGLFFEMYWGKPRPYIFVVTCLCPIHPRTMRAIHANSTPAYYGTQRYILRCCSVLINAKVTPY